MSTRIVHETGMDIFFRDPNEVPLPPEEIRILEFSASPYRDGRRVRVYLEVSPFQKRPNADIIVLDAGLRPISEVSIIESMTRKIEITMHLREPQPAGSYRVQATVYYEQHQPEPNQETETGETAPQTESGPPLVVDQAETTFELPPSEPNDG